MVKVQGRFALNQSDVPEQKMLRIFKVIQYLTTGKHTIRQLSVLTQMTERTIYRYLNLIEQIGYYPDCTMDGKYFITNECCPMCRKEIDSRDAGVLAGESHDKATRTHTFTAPAICH